MKSFDVFNGDADGICALHQLRLSDPRPEAILVTGVKRDIRLLGKIRSARDSRITVLDISLDRNRDPLLQLLNQGNRILYADHHFSGDIPASNQLEALIDPAPTTCTSLIIDNYLEGRHGGWAVTGAFGDNLDESARQRARSLNLADADIEALRETGILLNYNGYGGSLDDLFFPPDQLFRLVSSYSDPLRFHAESPALATLRQGYREDMERAAEAGPIHQDAAGRVFELPDASWSRRVAGVFSNTLAREKPELAHALLTANPDGTLRISVRAPLADRTGADELCRQFPTGGGRAAAAGINRLPAEQRDRFLSSFSQQFSS